MNKNAIKKFAIEARKKLMASVSDRAGMIGITPEGCGEPISKGIDFEVYKTVAGTEVTLGRTQCEQRRKLKEQIEARGYEAVVEEVAYTWFNRICAIRFMEVNDYLPTRVRVLSSEKEGKNEPDIVTQALDVDLDFTDKEREYILDCKMNNKLDELFKMLFIKQCNKLSEILPELFEATEDYTEMLLNISYTNKDDVISMLVNLDTGIPEADFNVSAIGEDGQPTGQVEIIGWLYQYYNTELKDDTFAKVKDNIKIGKERIPSVTQLFTPDWIVRYMVENSVGRIWIEHLRAIDSSVNEKEVAERFGWKYYLPEAEQEADVNVKLAEIRTSYKDLKPEDITCIDPCMGSGHILVAMFDVLMDIYKSAGYSERDAAFEIVEHNIHGLDIDKRAYQLAYFAIMMKGRGVNRRFFSGMMERNLSLCLGVFLESGAMRSEDFASLGTGMDLSERSKALSHIKYILDIFKDSREYGSLLTINEIDCDLIERFCDTFISEGQITLENLYLQENIKQLNRILYVARILSKKYYAVVTNPPYMSLSSGSEILNKYVKDSFPLSKMDLFSCFIERGCEMVHDYGYNCMVTMQSWMFLSSFEKMRVNLLKTCTISNLMHMENMVMGIAFGTAVTNFRKNKIRGYRGTYNLIKSKDVENNRPNEFPVRQNRFSQINTEKFSLIPGTPIAYWVSDNVFEAFAKYESLGNICAVKNGMSTTNNNKFLRQWYECDYAKLGIGYTNASDACASGKKWFPYNKGGEYRKWYGNVGLVVNWEEDGRDIKKAAEGASGGRIVSQEYYFKESISWSKVTSGQFVLRYFPDGFIFDVAGPSVFFEDDTRYYIMGVMNSALKNVFLQELYPTINFEMGQISAFPVNIDEAIKDRVVSLVKENIKISMDDWNSFETSWDFKTHPFLQFRSKSGLIEDTFAVWEKVTKERFDRVKSNEKELNDIFIDMYGLTDELNSEVEDVNISIRLANKEREIKSLLSYFVGLLVGRYALDKDGVQYKISPSEGIEQFIIPITDEEYFDNDIVKLLEKFIAKVFGYENLEANLEYIASGLGKDIATPRETIRNYFVNGFFNDHISNYYAANLGRKPIYWLFDSGKENAFKCIIYMHGYRSDMVGKVRIDYLHTTQKRIEQSLARAQYTRDNAQNMTEIKKQNINIIKYSKQLAEIQVYDEAMAHIASQRIDIDLDDGVKVNYEKFQGVEVAQEGKKALKIDLLAKIK